MRADRARAAPAAAIVLLALAACGDDASDAPAIPEVRPAALHEASSAPDVPPPIAEAPSTWPAGLPWIPGGTLLPARHDGAVHVARARWPIGVDALEMLLRSELDERGWQAGPATEEEEGIRRLVARREDREIAISIYADEETADEERTVVQTMELRLDRASPSAPPRRGASRGGPTP